MSAPSDAVVDTPPEVEATLTRLTAHKNVRGVLILSRPSGIILRSAGNLFAAPASTGTTQLAPTAPASNEAGTDGEAPPTATTLHSELARGYARLAQRLVDSVGEEVREVDASDDLRFLRIRTKKHELMITPDVQYILIVVQDPST